MKKTLIFLILAALICSGCANASPQPTETAEMSVMPEAADVTETAKSSETTAPDVVAEETKAPEDFDETGVAQEKEHDYPEIPFDTFVPLMPEADETAMSDETLVSEITVAFKQTDELLNMMYGNMGMIAGGEVYPVSTDIIPDPNNCSGEYHLSGIPDKAALLKLYDDAFSEKYLSGIDLNDLLFGNNALISYDDESKKTPYFITVDGNLLYYDVYNGVPYRFRDPIITYADENTVKACAAGTCLSVDNWSVRYTTFVKEDGVWKADSINTKDANYLGNILDELIGEEKTETLSRIGGCVEYITDSSGEKVYYSDDFELYYEIEPFMTTDEMKEFLYGIFTKDIADEYISELTDNFLYKDGKLYIKPQINVQSFGVFDIINSRLSRETYSGGNVFTAVNIVSWDSGSKEPIDVNVTLNNTADGLRIGTKLPVLFLGVSVQ